MCDARWHQRKANKVAVRCLGARCRPLRPPWLNWLLGVQAEAGSGCEVLAKMTMRLAVFATRKSR